MGYFLHARVDGLVGAGAKSLHRDRLIRRRFQGLVQRLAMGAQILASAGEEDFERHVASPEQDPPREIFRETLP